MIQFPEEYFKTEERDGFLVSEVMKRAWAAQMEILMRIIEICDRHGLTYYMYWGSLIGTVRHQGFIPWDDDVDIALIGEDYVRFLEVAKAELPPEYEVNNMYTVDDWDNYFTRIVNGDIAKCGIEYAEAYHGCTLTMGVDVFPLYYVPRDEQFAAQQRELLTLIGQAGYYLEHQENENLVQSCALIQEVTGYQFGGTKTMATQLGLLFDQISRMAKAEESDYVTSFREGMRKDYNLPKEWFEPIQMPYENIMVTVPKEYDAILRKTFGDYRIPIRGTAAHDYPSFQKQMKLFAKNYDVHDLCTKQGTENVSISVEENSADKKVPLEALQAALPKEWFDKIYQDGRRKKVLLYYTGSADAVIHCAELVDKLKSTFETVSKNEDVVLWWFPCNIANPRFSIIPPLMPETMKAYEKLKIEFLEKNYGILDESGDYTRAVAVSDAFYGDQGVLTDLYKNTKKPMMIENFEIF